MKIIYFYFYSCLSVCICGRGSRRIGSLSGACLFFSLFVTESLFLFVFSHCFVWWSWFYQGNTCLQRLFIYCICAFLWIIKVSGLIFLIHWLIKNMVHSWFFNVFRWPTYWYFQHDLTCLSIPCYIGNFKNTVFTLIPIIIFICLIYLIAFCIKLIKNYSGLCYLCDSWN